MKKLEKLTLFESYKLQSNKLKDFNGGQQQTGSGNVRTMEQCEGITGASTVCPCGDTYTSTSYDGSMADTPSTYTEECTPCVPDRPMAAVASLRI